MIRDLKPGLEEQGFKYEISTVITPIASGQHTLAARVTGSFSLSVDGTIVLSSSSQPDISMEDFLFEPARLEFRTSVPMEAGKPYSVRLVTQARIPKENDYEPTPHGATLCYKEAVDDRLSISEAVQIASSSDVSIIFAGRNHQHESEGFDLNSMAISTLQIKLIKAVAAVSNKTVLVLNCGNPIDVSSFVDDVDCVINAHFPGQEGGQALADILTGKTNPSGRLATTWPRKLDAEHVPTYHNFPAQLTDNGYTLKYAEGIQVGYRHPMANRTSQWEFGYGLSYTTFEYSKLEVTKGEHSSEMTVFIQVQNTGIFPGHEVVQVYVSPPKGTKIWRPALELKGFEKMWVLPGESKQVEISLDQRHACSYWDETANKWRLESGVYSVVVGPISANFEVKEETTWNGR